MTRRVEISQVQIAVLITIVNIVIELELNVEEVSTTIKKVDAEKLADDEVWMKCNKDEKMRRRKNCTGDCFDVQ